MSVPIKLSDSFHSYLLGQLRSGWNMNMGGLWPIRIYIRHLKDPPPLLSKRVPDLLRTTWKSFLCVSASFFKDWQQQEDLSVKPQPNFTCRTMLSRGDAENAERKTLRKQCMSAHINNCIIYFKRCQIYTCDIPHTLYFSRT